MRLLSANKGTEQIALFQQTNITNIRSKGAGTVKLRQNFSAGLSANFTACPVTRHEAVETSSLKRNKVFRTQGDILFKLQDTDQQC